ncbi:MAG: carboxypeptidase-like regulatory domain-containing protein [Planctomycetaceae bacterium]
MKTRDQFPLVQFLIVVAIGAVVSGCGGGGAEVPPLGIVSGVVKVDGKPIEGARVEFIPEAGGRPSSGVTDQDGKYTLSYADGVEGAAIGKHKVSVRTERAAFSPEGGEGVATEARLEMLPPEYNDATSLSEEVKAEPTVINFDLETKGFKPGTKRRVNDV